MRILYFKDHAGKRPPERAAAPRGFADLEERKGMLGFRGVRLSIEREAEGLSVYYRKRAPPMPDDYALRFSRIAYAMYLLGTLDRILKASGPERRAPPDFQSAQSAVAELLDERYFQKSADEIVAGYRKLAGPLERAASARGIQVLMPEDAVENVKYELADRIDSINGHCV